MKVRKKLVPKDKGCLSQPFKWLILPACLRSIFIIGVVARTDDQRIPSIITSQICFLSRFICACTHKDPDC